MVNVAQDAPAVNTSSVHVLDHGSLLLHFSSGILRHKYKRFAGKDGLMPFIKHDGVAYP